MRAYSVRMEHLEWFVKPGANHTFNAEAAAEPYTEAEAAEALAKGVGRVTAEALSRGRRATGGRFRGRIPAPKSVGTAIIRL